MTDSVSHNKFLSEDIPKLFNLDHKPGQLFCSVHTNLGFCASLNSSIHDIEVKHGLNNIMDGFIVDIDYQSKNGSCVGQFVDCMCRLVGSELKHKPWNCSKDFKNYCRDQGSSYEMFLYKDERFGCFPKACAVCLFSRDLIKDFLSEHPNITNRLACLVRDIHNLEYVALVMAVVAAFGIHLIETFHAVTISKKSNHDSLTVFYRGLHEKMEQEITDEFITLADAWYPGISKNLFEEVKKSYGLHVVDEVRKELQKYPTEALQIANHFQPNLQTTLARQRRDYGLDKSFVPEHPVEQLPQSVRENAPVHNLSMEGLCGKVGYRTAKN